MSSTIAQQTFWIFVLIAPLVVANVAIFRPNIIKRVIGKKPIASDKDILHLRRQLRHLNELCDAGRPSWLNIMAPIGIHCYRASWPATRFKQCSNCGAKGVEIVLEDWIFRFGGESDCTKSYFHVSCLQARIDAIRKDMNKGIKEDS